MIFWIIAFVIAGMSAGYFIRLLYDKWIESPIIMSMDPKPVTLNDFPFPSVTVCNMNNVKRTVANRINSGDDELQKKLLDDQCDFHNDTNDPKVKAQQWLQHMNSSKQRIRSSDDWSNILPFMVNVSQPCSDMLSVCEWSEIDNSCMNMFKSTMTDEGICCNFNSVRSEHMFHDPSVRTDLDEMKIIPKKLEEEWLDWNPEKGYKDAATQIPIPRQPLGTGESMGLTLVLNSELNEYYCSSTSGVGFKMFLHSPVETPRIAEYATALRPGSETRIIIKPKVTTASASIQRVAMKNRQCFFNSERKLRYYRTYTQKNCFLECETFLVESDCQCTPRYMPKSSNTRICGKEDNFCVSLARIAMHWSLYKVDSSGMERSEDIKKNMAVVHLFFVDSQFPQYVKNELFGSIDFLSYIGGLLGLFMGFSCLSIAEIIYFATLRIWCKPRIRQ